MTVCFVDTETTGLDPERHEIWEVGLILPDGSEHSWQLPVDLSRADSIALNIGRFHERRESWGLGCVSPEEMPEWCARFVALTGGLHLAGCVVSFDAERLARMLRANGECPMWHYHLIDCEALAAGYLAGLRSDAAELPSGEPSDAQMEHEVNMNLARPPWKSVDLSRAVGVEPDEFEKHTALGDARWAAAIYRAVMGE